MFIFWEDGYSVDGWYDVIQNLGNNTDQIDWSKAYVAVSSKSLNSGSSWLGNRFGVAKSDTDPVIGVVPNGVINSPV